MMMDDKKKQVTMIMAKMGKAPEAKETNEAGDEVDDSMPKSAAADELISALHSKDAKGVVEAFESLMELCSGSDYEAESSESTESEQG